MKNSKTTEPTNGTVTLLAKQPHRGIRLASVKARKTDQSGSARAGDEAFGAGLSALRFLEKYPWIDSDALQTHIVLTRAFLSLNQALTRYLMPQGLELSRAQYNFLAVLSLAEDNQLSLSEIAREVGVSAPYVTKLLDALEKEGLVERVADPSDRRVTHAHLTEQGKQRCQTIVPAFLRFIDEVGANLKPRERAQLRRLLAKYAQLNEARSRN